MTKAADKKAPDATKTPDGAGTEYTPEATASANSNGKASASVAGGDPVNSPVIGNPGENRPDMGYDYGLAARANAGNPIQPSAPMQSVQVLVPTAAAAADGKFAPGSADDDTEYAELVRARYKGHYDGVREPGEVFNNARNLPTYPEDRNSWFEDADRDPEWEAKEQSASRRRR